jgi:hypothetical protein
MALAQLGNSRKSAAPAPAEDVIERSAIELVGHP